MTLDCVVVLYGSAARDEADAHSDVDVLAVGDDLSIIPESSIPAGASVSAYDWHEWDALATEGSIFLHHLRDESQVLWSSGAGAERYRASLTGIGPYLNVSRDFDSFEKAIDDIEVEIGSFGAKNAGGQVAESSIEFELSGLAMVTRHLSILICYLLGEVNFSRLRSLEIAVSELKVGLTLANDFEYVYSFRLHCLGRLRQTPELPDIERVRIWVDESRQLLAAGRRLDG